MANRSFEVTTTPRDIKADATAAVVADTKYVVQNRTTEPILIADLATAPDPDTFVASHAISPGEWGFLTPSANPYWMWVANGTANLVINEAS